jgi:uncharacterized protein YjiS (DUF1127 family)
MQHTANSGALTRCLNYLRAKFRQFRLSAQIQAERKDLLRLDERALRDIGISRDDADRESGRSFGDIPVSRQEDLSGFASLTGIRSAILMHPNDRTSS